MKCKAVLKLMTAGLLAIASVAMAAETRSVLSNVVSPVMVNQGDAYVEAQEGMQLRSGDQLMVMTGGSAQVNYASGCVHKIAGNDIMHINNSIDLCNSPASAGTYNRVGATSTPPTGGGAATGGAGIAEILGGAAMIGFIGIAAYDISDDDNDNNRQPISP